MTKRICTIEGCERPARSRGWCSMHYHRWQRHGDPIIALVERWNPLARFWSRVDKRTDGCWIYTGALTPGGYSSLTIGQKRHYGHRWAYEQLVGPIPDGLELDHLCRVTSCVNPAHLEPVTHRENMLRGISPAAEQARQTHCKRGHPFDEANTYRNPTTGRRSCRTCHNERRRLLR